MVRWLQPSSPAGRAFAAGGYLLVLGVGQLSAHSSRHDVLMWLRLLAGLICALTGAGQLRTGVKLRRKRRTQLMQAVATALSELERRRREA